RATSTTRRSPPRCTWPTSAARRCGRSATRRPRRTPSRTASRSARRGASTRRSPKSISRASRSGGHERAMSRDRDRTLVYSLLLLVACLLAWQVLAGGAAGAAGKNQGIPGPLVVARTAITMLADPFYDRGPNDKGFGLQLGASLGRLVMGYVASSVVAVVLGVVLGSSPALFKAANPFIQVLKPISPLPWMPLFLYTIKNAGQAAVLVIFVSSLWATLANTAFGVASIKKDYLNVSRILQLSWPRRFFQVILPAAAPAIVAGLRISIGSAWVAIVAAEMLIGGTGVGYFVWNGWNNLALNSVMFAILAIGVVGVVLDFGLGRVARLVAYTE